MVFPVGIVMVPMLLFFSGSKLLGSTKPDGKPSIKRIKAIIDRFRQDLSITEKVSISIVARNERLVSVERSRARYGDSHSRSTKPSSMAWMKMSSVPRLHTNWGTSGSSHTTLIFRQNSWQIRLRLRVVSREELERIYAKVWRNNGDVDMKEFLGEDTAVGLKPEIRIKSLPRTTDRLSHP